MGVGGHPWEHPLPAPPQQSEEDVSQFDTRFTRQTPVDSPDDAAISESANQAFLVWGGTAGTPPRVGLGTHFPHDPPLCLQGFTYVAPSVLESIKEGFSFQPKVRSPRRLNSSPRTPVRYLPSWGGMWGRGEMGDTGAALRWGHRGRGVGHKGTGLVAQGCAPHPPMCAPPAL